MPTKNAKHIKLPMDVYERIVRLADEYHESYQNGTGAKVPLYEDCHGSKVPYHAIITKALDMLESHRARSRKK